MSGNPTEKPENSTDLQTSQSPDTVSELKEEVARLRSMVKGLQPNQGVKLRFGPDESKRITYRVGLEFSTCLLIGFIVYLLSQSTLSGSRIL
jgi:hypothetical protein